MLLDEDCRTNPYCFVLCSENVQEVARMVLSQLLVTGFYHSARDAVRKDPSCSPAFTITTKFKITRSVRLCKKREKILFLNVRMKKCNELFVNKCAMSSVN